MKILLRLLIGVALVSSGVVFAQDQRTASPMPPNPVQGNSLLLGQEPKLTHTVKVYWTTFDGIVTDIRVTATGRRPTQIHCDKSSEDKDLQLFSAINPRCDHNLRLSAAGSSEKSAEGLTTWRALGDGTVTIQVHGFKEEDYSRPPEVIVKYLRNGKVIGESNITGER